MKHIPQDAESLIKQLDELYPARCIAPGESLEDHLRYAGGRDLIQTLLDRLKNADGYTSLTKRRV